MKTAFESGLFSYNSVCFLRGFCRRAAPEKAVREETSRQHWTEIYRRERFFEKMKRFPSVKKNSDFQRAYQTGRSYASSALVMYVCENGCRHNRLGVSCSKKIGNSIVRHTFARKMREIFRLNDFRVKQGLDIIIVIRGKANYCTYQQIEQQYLNLLNRHHILIKDTEEKQKPTV